MGPQNLLFSGALPKTLQSFWALKVAVTLAFIGTNLMEIVSPHGRGLGALLTVVKLVLTIRWCCCPYCLAILGIALYYVIVVINILLVGQIVRISEYIFKLNLKKQCLMSVCFFVYLLVV